MIGWPLRSATSATIDMRFLPKLANHMPTNENSWIEQLYKYVEYYYWTPNDLNKKGILGKTGSSAFEEVRNRMRRNEVPLNAIFNISLCILPAYIIEHILASFVVNKSTKFGKAFRLINTSSWEQYLDNFTQPDVAIESDSARIFIELKVDAPFTLSQVHKYLFLHTIWSKATQQEKKPYIFFLSRNGLLKQWDASERTSVFHDGHDVDDLYKYLKKTDLPIKLGNKESIVHLHDGAKHVLDKLELGFTTWQLVGECLWNEIERIAQTHMESEEEITTKLISDLLDELKNRKLWAG